MNYIRCIKTAALLVMLVTFIGCKSKQDAPVATPATPQEKGAAPAGAPQLKPAASVVSPKDRADAQAAATRVLALLESGDFPSLYKESADGFKQIGSESQFVSKFQETRTSVGVLKNPREISFGTLPGNGFVFVYRLENERYKSDIRLTFTRSQGGKMELAGLNQHDEQRK